MISKFLSSTSVALLLISSGVHPELISGSRSKTFLVDGKRIYLRASLINSVVKVQACDGVRCVPIAIDKFVAWFDGLER